MKKKKKGFTLIELIAVIAILAILAIVAVPRVITYVEKSKKVAIQTEAKMIYDTAQALYSNGEFYNPDYKITKDNFDEMTVGNVITIAKDKNRDLNLASNHRTFPKEYANFAPYKLSELKAIINTDTNKLEVSSDGKLLGHFDNENGVIKYNPAENSQQ